MQATLSVPGLDGPWRPEVNDRVSDIREQLESLGEQLAELSIDVLRQAVDDGETTRPPLEKKLTQARRAVEKATRLLDGT